MHDAKLSKLFDRYRAKSDLGALAEVFDLVSPELLRVARHVAGRGVDPEDLVQATFLAAIERAATFDAERPLVPWLLGILINQSRLTKRRRSTTLPDEAAASIAAAEPPLDGAESHEIDEAVTRALDTLPEMYREVLVPHISDGKKPHEIARDLGRPQGTVRAQIHRGIRLMRKALPAGFAFSAIAVLRPDALANVREHVLREAARQTGQGPAAIQAAASRSAMRLLRKRLFVGAAGVAVIGALWFAWPRSQDRVPVDALARQSREVGASADVASPPSTPAQRSALASAVTTEPAVAASADPYGSVLVHVIRAESKEPARDVRVTLIPWGDPRWFETVAEGRTDAHGDLVFERVHAGRIGVHVDRGVQTRYDVIAGERARIDTTTEKGIAVHATIVDTNGRAVPGAVVEVYADRDASPRFVSAAADAHGVVELTDVDARFWVAARIAGHAPSRSTWLGNPTHANDATPSSITLLVGEDTTSLSGRIVDETGAPIVGAAVRVESADVDDPRWTSGGSIECGLPPTTTKSDEFGRFAAEVALSRALAVRVDAPGYAAFAAHVEGNGAMFDPLRVTLKPAAIVRGSARFRDGSIAPSTSIVIDASTDSPELRVQCDAAGNFTFSSVAAGRHTIRARAGGIGPEVVQPIVVDAREPCEWKAILDHPETISGRAIGEDGRPVRTWLVLASPEDEVDAADDHEFLGRWTRTRVGADTSTQLLQAWSAADGSFVVPCKSGATHRLELRARGSWRGPVQANAKGVRAGEQNVVVRVKLVRSGIEGDIGDSNGDPIGPATLIATSRELTGEATAPIDPRTGHFDIALMPGTYDLVVWPRDARPRHIGRRVLAVGERISLGKCALAACGELEISDERPASLEPEVWSSDGWRASVARTEGGAWLATLLPPGEYRVVLRTSTGERAERQVSIASKQTARLSSRP